MKGSQLIFSLLFGLVFAYGGCQPDDSESRDSVENDDQGSTIHDDEFGSDSYPDENLGVEVCDGHDQCGEAWRCLDGRCLEAPPQCTGDGEPIVAGCANANTAQDCKSASGTWACVPLACSEPGQPPECRCACHTGDSGCPCWADTHCQGWCDFGLTTSLDSSLCLGVGQCSSVNYSGTVGCRCVWQGSGPPIVLCTC